MKKIIYIIVFLFIQDYAFSQSEKVKVDIALTVNEMRKMRDLQISPISNWDGKPLVSWGHFCNLRDNATDEQLLRLLNDTSAVVKGYSFLILCERKNRNIYKIVKQHLTDNQEISWLNTDYGRIQRIGDFFINEAIDRKLISEKQKKKLQQKILNNTDILLYYNNIVFNEVEKNEQNYLKIRRFATEKNSYSAVVALSKYQKQEDKILIEKLLANEDSEDFGFRCIIYFPDSTFIPYLNALYEKVIDKNRKAGFGPHKLRIAYKAVASYKNQFSVNYFNNILQNCPSERYAQQCKFIWFGIRIFPCPIFEELNSKVEDIAKKETFPLENEHALKVD